MSNNAFGLYNLGLLYSKLSSGTPYELTLIAPTGVGCDDILATIRLVSLLHETSHFLHDLSLGTCLNRDFLLDEAAAVLFNVLRSLTNEDRVICPLVDSDGETSFTGQTEREHVGFILERSRLAELPLNQPFLLDTSPLTIDSNNALSDETTLTGMHLLEGIVAIKTLFGLAQRINTEEDQVYLKKIVEDLPLLPDKLGSIYYSTPRLFDATIGVLLAGINPRTLRSWPDDIKMQESIRKLVDIGFLYTADIALHVPPIEVITERIRDGRNDSSDFQPVPRFLKVIEIITQHGSFPSGVDDGQNFYQILYDWIAERANWPGYEITQGAWESKIRQFRGMRQSMSDGFRYRMLIERRIRSMNVLVNEPMFVSSMQSIPLVYLSPAGLRCLQTYGGRISIPLEFPMLPVWYLMNIHPTRWQNSLQEATFSENMDLERSRRETFLQEIVMRSMCRAVQSAILQEDFLKCPWAEGGCHVAQSSCQRIQQLGEIPQNECSLRKYIEWLGISPDRIVWRD